MASTKYVLPKGYLSASAIGMLQRCPKQYEFRYVEDKVIPPNAALTVGSVLHKTFETYYQDAMSSSQRLTSAQAGELSVDTFETWLGENEVDMTSEEKEESKKLLPDLSSGYVTHIGSKIVPVATETEVKFTTASGVDILGYIDLIHELPTPENWTDSQAPVGIADYKVTGKPWSLRDLQNSLQFNLYASMTGINNVEIHNVLKAPGKPISKKSASTDGVTVYASNVRVIEYTFTNEQRAHFEYLVERAAALITSGVFMPCDPSSWVCTPDWCGYWSLCRGRPSG